MTTAEKDACTQAIRWLARREYCRQEMLQKLIIKGHEQAVAMVVVNYLAQNDYMSERRYAEAYLRSRLHRGETPTLAAHRARQKGVDEKMLQHVLQDNLAHYDAKLACKTWLNKRDPEGLRHQDQRMWARLARFLCHKGFESSLVLHLMRAKDEDTV
ncbi:MAG: regulatory protein RecX [Mariprofundaceae bacterium]|nr:regulatory protein RecX [Mariprofundaceae bacterium]